MSDSDSTIDAAEIAASSSEWEVRARAGHDLANWADRPEVADLLLRLLLDTQDTAVTVMTCDALLRRNDVHGIRPLAYAVATARDLDYLDHFYAAISQHLFPDGPITVFIDVCTALTNDPDQPTRTGARELLRWAQPTGHTHGSRPA